MLVDKGRALSMWRRARSRRCSDEMEVGFGYRRMLDFQLCEGVAVVEADKDIVAVVENLEVRGGQLPALRLSDRRNNQSMIFTTLRVFGWTM